MKRFNIIYTFLREKLNSEAETDGRAFACITDCAGFCFPVREDYLYLDIHIYGQVSFFIPNGEGRVFFPPRAWKNAGNRR